MSIETTLGVLLGGAATIAVYSYLYRENPVYRLAEYLVVGLSSGHLVVITATSLFSIAIAPLIKGQVVWLIPIVLGIMMYVFFSKKYNYLYRIPLAFLVGIGTGLSIRGAADAQLRQQILATITTDFSKPNSWILFVGVIFASLYFVFSFGGDRMAGPSKWFGNIGRWFLMAAFGAGFGSIVQGRISSATGRLTFLLTTEAIYLIPIAVAALAAYLAYSRQQRKP